MIRLLSLVLAAGTCLWAASSLAAEEAKPEAPKPAGALADIVARIPNDDRAAAEKACAELLRLGPKGVTDLCALLVEPGKGDDSRARFAVHGLALYVSRPGAEPERLMVCQALREQLGGPMPTAVKGFILRQLRLMACPAAVAAISGSLLNEELCEYAAHALVSIGGEGAAKALRDALPKAKGKCRLTIIQDLGVLRDAPSAPELLKAAAESDREIRLAALYGLGNIGDAAATDVLLKASNVEAAYERAKATEAVLLLAGRLAEADKKREAEQIYRTLWKTRTDPKDRHVRCAAISGLAAVLGAGAMDDLVAAMKSDDPQVRAAAIEAAAAAPGDEATRKWADLAKTMPPAARADILALLARRGGPVAVGAVLDAMKDADEFVRLEAINAARSFGDEKVAAPLIALLPSKNDKEKQAARRSLERMPGEKVTGAVAAAMASAPTPLVKRDLLGIMAARGARGRVDVILAAAKDPDEGVRADALSALEGLADEASAPAILSLLLAAKTPNERQAAEKALGAVCGRASRKDACVDAVLGAMGSADGSTKCALIRVLGRTGSAKALGAVRAAAKDAAAEIQDAGIRALADWPEPSVAGDLLEIAKTGTKPAQQVLALRGYIRLANVPPERPVAEKLKAYEQAMSVAKRPDEKKMVLGALGDLKDPAAMEMAVAALADAALKEEAAAAAVKIAKNLGGNPKDRIKAAMGKVLEVTKNDGTRKDAEQVLQKVK